MPATFMLFWSAVVLFLSGARIRNYRRWLLAMLVSALVLLVSQTLFIQLSNAAGISTGYVLNDYRTYLFSGPTGWLALFIWPFGWLGPVIGLHAVQRRG